MYKTEAKLMRPNSIIPVITLIICLTATTVTLAKATHYSPEKPGYWGIQVENDVFSSSDDRFYTNGFQINYVKRDSPPDWLDKLTHKLPFFNQTGVKGAGYSFGQKIFTPEDKTATALIKNDRPYAGWLYGGASVTNIIKDEPEFRDLNAFEFAVGIVGPSSQAGYVQNKYHDLIGVENVNGWDNQLKDEAGVLATYVRKQEYFNHLNNGLEYSWSPHGVLALGNIYTYAGGGMMFRLGNNLNNDIGPPSISPGFPGAAYFRPSKGRSWYLFGGLEARVVAQNIFLDGNTFKDSHSVNKKPFVMDSLLGVASQRDNIRLSYSHVIRSKEFDGQKENADFGSLNLSFFLD